MRRAAAVLFGLLALTGCDPAWTLDIAVTVPEEARTAVGAYPQEVLVTFDETRSGNKRSGIVAVLCDPAVGDVIVESKMFGGLSGPSAVLTAWIQAQPQERRGERCGWRAKEVESIPATPVPSSTWFASADVFQNGGLHEKAQIVLASH